jgi:hypothetical protein
MLVVFLAISAILLAFEIAPQFDVIHLDLLQACGFGIVFMLNTTLGWGVSMKRWLPAYLLFFGLWLGTWYAVEQNFGGALIDRTFECNMFIIGFMLILSSLNKPVEPTAIGGAIFIRLIAILTNQPMLAFLSLSQFANLCQGLSHKLSGE